MKMIRTPGFGGEVQLRLGRVPGSDPSAGELLFWVHATGVNPYNWLTRQGDGADLSFPWTPGKNLSRVVEAIGNGVTAYNSREEGFGMLANGRGTYVEYVAVPAWNLVSIISKNDMVS